MLTEQIQEALLLDAPFRSAQIFKWIGSGAQSFDDMTNLPKDLRLRLSETACVRSTSVSQKLADPDGTVKLQIRLHDGLAVETVLLTDSENRRTACVSCQAGCRMGCAFCKTGSIGFGRNLEAGEITEQFFHLEAETATRDNIVFMRMAEPTENLAAVRQATEVLTHPAGRNLSKRRITVSTAGIPEGIYDIADNGPAVRLAVSLTTADEELRRRLMPAAGRYPLAGLHDAVRYFCDKTGKRCTLEAVLLSGVNTTERSAEKLIDFARGLNVHINLIPWNPVKGFPFTEPSAKETAVFVRMLERAGLNVTVRTRRGRKIGGACGQLGSVMGKEDA